MVTAEMVSAAVAFLGLLGAAGGFLYNRDESQQEDIDDNADAIEELDTSFARLQTRLFGHPEDEARGLAGEVDRKGDRVDEAEQQIDSLQQTVRDVATQAERNGEQIDAVTDEVHQLEEAVTTHAQDTREALTQIQAQLDGVDVLPDGGDREHRPEAEGEGHGS